MSVFDLVYTRQDGTTKSETLIEHGPHSVALRALGIVLSCHDSDLKVPFTVEKRGTNEKVEYTIVSEVRPFETKLTIVSRKVSVDFEEWERVYRNMYSRQYGQITAYATVTENYSEVTFALDTSKCILKVGFTLKNNRINEAYKLLKRELPDLVEVYGDAST